jgi:hypothetical protein
MDFSQLSLKIYQNGLSFYHFTIIEIRSIISILNPCRVAMSHLCIIHIHYIIVGGEEGGPSGTIWDRVTTKK